MRILQICHSYYPPFLDCARQYAALADGTPYKVVTVYLTGEPDEEVAKKSHSDEVIFLGFKSKEVSGLKLKAIAKIKEIVKREQFAFCIAHRVKPTYIALLGTKLPVVSVHHNYFDYNRWSRRLMVNRYQKRLLMLGVSNAVRDALRSDLKGWDHSRIETLYNRINVKVSEAELLTKDEARKSLNLPHDAWVVGNVGRLHADKDQATLIKGFHQALPDLPNNSMLYIAGKGPLEAELQSLIGELKLSEKVILAGSIENAKRYFKAFDIFALTSDREPFGMVLLEAMVAGLPIVCTLGGGGEEVVQGLGELFEFGSVSALSHALKKCVHIEAQEVKKKSLQRLNERFSDGAARAKFWKLSKVLEG